MKLPKGIVIYLKMLAISVKGELAFISETEERQFIC